MAVDKSTWVFSVTDAEFQARVVENSKDVPVVVDFWAPWCGPCRQLTPMLERLIADRQGEILLAKVNIDEEQRLAADFRIDSVPTVIAFRDGRPVLDFIGLLSESEVRHFLDRVGPSDAEREVKRATQLEKSDPAQAEAAYRAVLARDRNQELALLGLARLLLSQGDDSEASALLENLGPGSVHADEAERLSAQLALRKLTQGLPAEESLRAQVEADPKNALARYQLGCVLAVSQRFSDALEHLLAAGERDSKLASTMVREAMVQIFHLIGNDTALANDYRNRLSLLLY